MKAKVQVYLSEYNGDEIRIVRCRSMTDHWLVRVGEDGDTLCRSHPRAREPEKLDDNHLTWLPYGTPWHDEEWMARHTFTLEEITEKLGIEF